MKESNELISIYNESIAIFMGWEKIKIMNDIGEINSIYVEQDAWRTPDGKKPTNLCFHNNWNWLMPVVEKIESIGFGIKQCRKVIEVYDDTTKEKLFGTKTDSRIRSLYDAVIFFVNWYNEK